MIIVADTGPLIALSLLDKIPDIHDLYTTIYVPEGVIREATHAPDKIGVTQIQSALAAGQLTAITAEPSEALQRFKILLDLGESEALAIAQQLEATALIDEKRGRQVAKAHGIAVTGTVAVLIQAKHHGKITAIKPLLMQLNQHGYRLSPALIQHALQHCNES